MAILRLNDPGTRQVLHRFQLTPERRVGRGQYCAVYDDGVDVVIKLTVDPIQLESVRDYLVGTHFPRLTQNIGYVGEQFSGDLSLRLFKAERLRATRHADLPTRRLVRKLMTIVDRCWSSPTAINQSNVRGSPEHRLAIRTMVTLEQAAEDTQLPESIRDALQDIIRMARDYDNLVLDFHGANLMVRGSDELIFNDVVVTGELLPN